MMMEFVIIPRYITHIVIIKRWLLIWPFTWPNFALIWSLWFIILASFNSYLYHFDSYLTSHYIIFFTHLTSLSLIHHLSLLYLTTFSLNLTIIYFYAYCRGAYLATFSLKLRLILTHISPHFDSYFYSWLTPFWLTPHLIYIYPNPFINIHT